MGGSLLGQSQRGKRWMDEVLKEDLSRDGSNTGTRFGIFIFWKLLGHQQTPSKAIIIFFCNL